MTRLLPAVAVLLALASPAAAAPPSDPAGRAEVAGTPTAVEVFPATVNLSGVRDARQLVVTGRYADGTVRDLTTVTTATVDNAAVVDIQDGLFLRPKANGSATLTLAVGGKSVPVPVVVGAMDRPRP
jgi:hypothetical protein